jgi:hypothetical protein
MPLLLGEPANEEEAKASDEEASGDDESERVLGDADEGEMVAAPWLRILPGDEDSDDDDGDDGDDGGDDDDGGDGDGDGGGGGDDDGDCDLGDDEDDEDDEDPPEQVQDLNMEPLPAENVPNYPQQNTA